MNQEMYSGEIAVLCTQVKSIYKTIPRLNCYDEKRDAYTFTACTPVITHAPCQQWSQLRNFAHENKKEKELAYFCFEKVQKNGGIFEHPSGTSFFKHIGVNKNIISVNQSWWGYPCRKKTLLYFQACSPLSYPLSFDAPTRIFNELSPLHRSRTSLSFALWLIDCIRQTFPYG